MNTVQEFFDYSNLIVDIGDKYVVISGITYGLEFEVVSVSSGSGLTTIRMLNGDQYEMDNNTAVVWDKSRSPMVRHCHHTAQKPIDEHRRHGVQRIYQAMVLVLGGRMVYDVIDMMADLSVHLHKTFDGLNLRYGINEYGIYIDIEHPGISMARRVPRSCNIHTAIFKVSMEIVQELTTIIGCSKGSNE